MVRFKLIGVVLLIGVTVSIFGAREVLLEYKGAYFLPTNARFKECYKGTALSGPELTVQLSKDKHWYGFASIDYLKKEGRCLSRCDSTTLKLLPLALGIKYFFPVFKRTNLYLGLGFQPTHIATKTSRAFVVSTHKQWAFGGIAKMGTYIDMPHNFVLDLFIDYSFIRTNRRFYGNTVTKKAHINGALFGAGLGYRF